MKRMIDSMAKCQRALGGILLAACLVFIVLQIFSGYVGMEVTWAKSAALYSMIWGIFVESGRLVHERSHFAFTVVSHKIRSVKAVALWDMGIAAVKIVFSALLIYYGFKLSMESGSGAKPEFLTRGHIWLCLPFCGVTSLIYLFYQIACDLHVLREGGRT